MKSKASTIIIYIIIGILLLPVIAIGLYLLLGISAFLILYIIDRVKNGKPIPQQGKPYKIASTIVFIIAALICYAIFGTAAFMPLTWKGFFCIQAMTFIGLIPLDIFYILKLKKH